MIGFLTISSLPNSNTPTFFKSPSLTFASYNPVFVLSLNLSDCSSPQTSLHGGNHYPERGAIGGSEASSEDQERSRGRDSFL